MAELNLKAMDGTSPVPTTAPRPQFAAIPELRRDVVSSNTCGFKTDDGELLYHMVFQKTVLVNPACE